MAGQADDAHVVLLELTEPLVRPTARVPIKKHKHRFLSLALVRRKIADKMLGELREQHAGH